MTENTVKVVNSASVTLKASGIVMRITALRRRDESAVTFVTTTGEDKKTVRGMTESHADFATARSAMNALAASATKLGWAKGSGGYKSRPDAFSSLPAVPKAKK